MICPGATERGRQAPLPDAKPVGLGEFDQPAKATLLLRLMIDEDFGQTVIEERI
jgi:hypothetical protein